MTRSGLGSGALPGLVLAAALTLAACRGSRQAAGDRLARELPEMHPEQIIAIEFENSPPLDPPTLWIDLSPSMTPDEQRRFRAKAWANLGAATGAGVPKQTRRQSTRRGRRPLVGRQRAQGLIVPTTPDRDALSPR